MFEQDRQWFLQHKDELLAKYSGQFIAILDGKVVRSNPDFEALARQVYEKHGYRDLFMPKVEQQPSAPRMPAPRRPVSDSHHKLNQKYKDTITPPPT